MWWSIGGGIIIFALGMFIFLKPGLIWKLTEEWKSYRADEPSKIEKMLGYTNMDSEKGFAFFQRFLREQGIIKELENMGIEDGDTVRMYDFEFDYYK